MSGNDIEDLLSGLKSVIEDAIAKKRKAPKKKVYAARDETEEFVQFWDTWRPHARQNMRQDLDNRSKAILDCLQHYQVIKNDNLCERLTMCWSEDLPAECVVILQIAEEGLAA